MGSWPDQDSRGETKLVAEQGERSLRSFGNLMLLVFH